MVLPAKARGRTLTFFEEQRQVLSSPATPGGTVDLTAWPRYVTAEFPRGLNTLVVPPPLKAPANSHKEACDSFACGIQGLGTE